MEAKSIQCPAWGHIAGDWGNLCLNPSLPEPKVLPSLAANYFPTRPTGLLPSRPMEDLFEMLGAVETRPLRMPSPKPLLSQLFLTWQHLFSNEMALIPASVYLSLLHNPSSWLPWLRTKRCELIDP